MNLNINDVCWCSVKIVSEAFEGKKLVARHRMVYALVQEELDAGLHALSMKLHTPGEADKLAGTEMA